MQIRERTEVHRPAAEVWPYVIRPENFQKWNTKITSMDVTGEFRLGHPFTTHYLWKNRPIQCVSRATAIVEGRMLELRHCAPAGPGIPPDLEVTERVTLEERRGRTIVTKVVTIRNHQVPWLLRPLIGFVSRFGKPVGPEPLKSLVEGGG
jgi:hypothetical protein